MTHPSSLPLVKLLLTSPLQVLTEKPVSIDDDFGILCDTSLNRQIYDINNALTDVSSSLRLIDNIKVLDTSLLKKVVLKHYIYKNSINGVFSVPNEANTRASVNNSIFLAQGDAGDNNGLDVSYNRSTVVSTSFCLRDTIMTLKVPRKDALEGIDVSNEIYTVIGDDSGNIIFDVDPLNILVDMAAAGNYSFRLDLVINATIKYSTSLDTPPSYDANKYTDKAPIDDKNSTDLTYISLIDAAQKSSGSIQSTKILLDAYVNSIKKDLTLNGDYYLSNQKILTNTNKFAELPIYFTDPKTTDGRLTSPYSDPNAFLKVNTFYFSYNLYYNTQKSHAEGIVPYNTIGDLNQTHISTLDLPENFSRIKLGERKVVLEDIKDYDTTNAFGYSPMTEFLHSTAFIGMDDKSSYGEMIRHELGAPRNTYEYKNFINIRFQVCPIYLLNNLTNNPNPKFNNTPFNCAKNTFINKIVMEKSGGNSSAFETTFPDMPYIENVTHNAMTLDSMNSSGVTFKNKNDGFFTMRNQSSDLTYTLSDFSGGVRVGSAPSNDCPYYIKTIEYSDASGGVDWLMFSTFISQNENISTLIQEISNEYGNYANDFIDNLKKQVDHSNFFTPTYLDNVTFLNTVDNTSSPQECVFAMEGKKYDGWKERRSIMYKELTKTPMFLLDLPPMIDFTVKTGFIDNVSNNATGDNNIVDNSYNLNRIYLELSGNDGEALTLGDLKYKYLILSKAVEDLSNDGFVIESVDNISYKTDGPNIFTKWGRDWEPNDSSHKIDFIRALRHVHGKNVNWSDISYDNLSNLSGDYKKPVIHEKFKVNLPSKDNIVKLFEDNSWKVTDISDAATKFLKLGTEISGNENNDIGRDYLIYVIPYTDDSDAKNFYGTNASWHWNDLSNIEGTSENPFYTSPYEIYGRIQRPTQPPRISKIYLKSGPNVENDSSFHDIQQPRAIMPSETHDLCYNIFVSDIKDGGNRYTSFDVDKIGLTLNEIKIISQIAPYNEEQKLWDTSINVIDNIGIDKVMTDNSSNIITTITRTNEYISLTDSSDDSRFNVNDKFAFDTSNIHLNDIGYKFGVISLKKDANITEGWDPVSKFLLDNTSRDKYQELTYYSPAVSVKFFNPPHDTIKISSIQGDFSLNESYYDASNGNQSFKNANSNIKIGTVKISWIRDNINWGNTHDNYNRDKREFVVRQYLDNVQHNYRKIKYEFDKSKYDVTFPVFQEDISSSAVWHYDIVSQNRYFCLQDVKQDNINDNYTKSKDNLSLMPNARNISNNVDNKIFGKGDNISKPIQLFNHTDDEARTSDNSNIFIPNPYVNTRAIPQGQITLDYLSSDISFSDETLTSRIKNNYGGIDISLNLNNVGKGLDR